MAGIDYVSCDECGERLFYDGGREVRDYMSDVGTAGVVCGHCVAKLKKKIKKLEKYDKRRH